MEWKSTTASDWNWGTRSLYSAKATEISKGLQHSSTEIRGDGEVHSGSAYISVGGSFSSSDFSYDSLSKSSISASADPSSMERTKTYSTVAFPKGFSGKYQLARVDGSGTLGAFLGSDEPPIRLKLGKRTYFEEVCTSSTNNASSMHGAPIASATTKRSRVVYQSAQAPCCQVEGCNLDLKSAKDYHRKHRICESHSKSPKVVVAGMVRRFCQQCSRFHDLLEFDDKKRSCRRRLSDHNARRRRPQVEGMHFKLSRLASSFYDARQQMNLVTGGVLVPTINSTWQSACRLKVPLPAASSIRPTKVGGVDRLLDMPADEILKSISMLDINTSRVPPLEGNAPQMFDQGFEASAIASNLDISPDLQYAPSLLSTNIWGLNEPGSDTLDQFVHLNQSSVIHPVLHAESQNWASSENVHGEQLPSDSRLHSLDSQNSISSPFQELQFFKFPYDSDCFY